MIIKVCLPLPVKNEFDYETPFDVNAGCRVVVPFAGKKIASYCTQTRVKTLSPNLKSVLKQIDSSPLLTEELLELSLMMEERYFTSRGMALKMILPPDVKGVPRRIPEGVINPAGKESPPENASSAGIKLTGLSYITGNLSSLNGVLRENISRIVKSGRQIIFLVPQRFDIKKYAGVFGGFRWASFNSQFSLALRHSVLKAASDGEIDIVAGTRSAVFTPFRKLGMIIMINPQNKNYTEEQHPHYSAEEIAVFRAEKNNAVFAGAEDSLSVNQYFNVKRGLFNQVALSFGSNETKTRINAISDTPVEFGISGELLKKIKEALLKGGSALLYSTRSGWATSFVCSACGYIVTCGICSKKLIVSKFNLFCPKCRKSYPKPDFCPRCGRKKMKNKGFGRAMIASYLRNKFPHYSVYSVGAEDSGEDKKKLFDDFASGKINILLADASFASVRVFPKYGLFAVLDADFLLYGGDWRAEEKTFLWLRKIRNFLRSVSSGAELYVQTKLAADLCSKTFSESGEFYEEQLKEREKFNFPPFARIIHLEISGKNASDACGIIERELSKTAVFISPPSEVPAEKTSSEAEDVRLRPKASGGKKVYEIILKIKPEDIFSLPQVKGARIRAEEEI